MRDCANCFHRKPVLKEDGTWTAECEKWDCEFQSRENMIEKTKAMNNDLISRSALKIAIREATYGLDEMPIRVDRLIALIDNSPTISPEIATKLQPNCNNLQSKKGEYKCVTCKYRSCEITEKPCRECSRSWVDRYEEADMRGEDK